MPYYWGVNSAETVTKDLYERVLRHLGKPSYWGRFISPVPNESEGLQREEIKILRNNGTKILPVYNNFSEATGYREGTVIAQNMIFNAKRLGIPKGKVLFTNVEKTFNVDEEWIRGYVDAMSNSIYKPGIYSDSINGVFNAAYSEAVNNDNRVGNQVILWSASPEPGVTKLRNAPNFKPRKPSSKANVWGWQYGRDARTCPVDTNLINGRLYDLLW